MTAVLVVGIFFMEAPRELAWVFLSPIISTLAAAMFLPNKWVPSAWNEFTAVAVMVFFSLIAGFVCFCAVVFLQLLWAFDSRY